MATGTRGACLGASRWPSSKQWLPSNHLRAVFLAHSPGDVSMPGEELCSVGPRWMLSKPGSHKGESRNAAQFLKLLCILLPCPKKCPNKSQLLPGVSDSQEHLNHREAAASGACCSWTRLVQQIHPRCFFPVATASRSTLPLPLLPNARPLFATRFSPTGTSHCVRRPPSARWIPHVPCHNLHHTLLSASFHHLPSRSRVLMPLWMARMPEENPGSSENSVCSSVLFRINFWHGRKAKQGLCLAVPLAYFCNCEKVTQTLESSVPVWKRG